ncbi:unnamed protein product [Brachionus calyciflorus]|uniref:Reverse transcriptase domain-containing protein n=1 Tax=Brachionus calyciflorus TaxID=104777 RepID=A0A814MVV1_9BILA|nr:unnamed protein product [Brachionus calyciflorus]
MDFSEKLKNNIHKFTDNNDLINFVNKPTRISTKYYKNLNKTKQSSTLIDVILHNADLIEATDVIHCPFSDHHFVVAYVPIEWKTAVVKPLFKKKGSNDDLNNYRAISILPPIAKLFEKLIHKQILDNLNKSKIILSYQHGFRANHSCESALHEIISEINKIRSKGLIGLLLFIDFKKAFDIVDSRLLLLKLKKYGFSNTAILLIKSYFENRFQYVKIEDYTSDQMAIKLVPQGIVLGPLLFLISINDIVSYLDDFIVKLFVDDTTILQTDSYIESLISNFNNSVTKLIS